MAKEKRKENEDDTWIPIEIGFSVQSRNWV